MIEYFFGIFESCYDGHSHNPNKTYTPVSDSNDSYISYCLLLVKFKDFYLYLILKI